jgi:hypothetical protein
VRDILFSRLRYDSAMLRDHHQTAADDDRLRWLELEITAAEPGRTAPLSLF